MLLWALLLGRATGLTFGVCGGRMCKQKYQAWKSRKEPGKGLEVGRVVPKWIPGDDYCTLLERVEACGRDDLFVQTVKCRGSCERGPNSVMRPVSKHISSSSISSSVASSRAMAFGPRSQLPLHLARLDARQRRYDR